MPFSVDLFARLQEPERLPMDDAEVSLQRAFYDAAQAARYMELLLQETPWRQEFITLWGKRHAQPRLCAWYADPGLHYSYSGLRLQAQPWSATLQQIRRDLEAACGQRFNSVLLNLYRDQHDSMGWHSDDEAELGANPVIASLSFGAARKFKFKRKNRTPQRALSIELANGSLLLMGGATQHHWQHAIARQSAPCGARINLTFRHIYAANAKDSTDEMGR